MNKLFLSTIIIFFSLNLCSQTIINKGVELSGFSTEYYSLPFIDLDMEYSRQVVVDKEPGQYLGHPSTVLLEDGKTMICVYPKGHGKGPIIMKKSYDGGLTWTDRLPVPDSWASSMEVPVLFPVEDAAGKKRMLLFSGLFPSKLAISEDKGQQWSELKAIGDWGGIVVMGDLVSLNYGRNGGKGHYMAMFHDDERFISHKGRSLAQRNWASSGLPKFTLYKTFSFDGGVHWSEPEAVFSSRVLHLCEPGIIRSPDGNQIAVLLRENARRGNSHIIFSNDNGKTWTPPRPLPNALNGDRHQAIYAPDGRLVISFRDNAPAFTNYKRLKDICKNCNDQQLHQQAGPVSPTHGDWVAWVGQYEDLVKGHEGQYRVRLKDNTKGSDCAYPAMELLPDGTIVATTYGHWDDGAPPYILSVRFKMEELDKLAKK